MQRGDESKRGDKGKGGDGKEVKGAMDVKEVTQVLDVKETTWSRNLGQVVSAVI